MPFAHQGAWLGRFGFHHFFALRLWSLLGICCAHGVQGSLATRGSWISMYIYIYSIHKNLKEHMHTSIYKHIYIYTPNSHEMCNQLGRLPQALWSICMEGGRCYCCLHVRHTGPAVGTCTVEILKTRVIWRDLETDEHDSWLSHSQSRHFLEQSSVGQFLVLNDAHLKKYNILTARPS